MAGAVTLTILELERRLPKYRPQHDGSQHRTGDWRRFSRRWLYRLGLFQSKELAMSIADWINDRRAKDRAMLITQGYDQGYDEGYKQGYADARSGRPRRVEATPGDQPGPAAPPPLRPRRRRSATARNA